MNIGKKLLSLLIVFCLTLSLVPTVALAAGTASVKLRYNSSLEFEMVNEDNTTYYTGSSVTTTQPTSWKAKYEPTTNTLTLNNYVGGPVIANGNLTILLDSTNNITSVNNGINITGNLTIEGTGSLELTGARNTTIYASGDITIQGGAKVKATGGQDGQAIHAVGGTVTIKGSGTKVTATKGSGSAIRTGGDTNPGTVQLSDGACLKADGIVTRKNGFLINGVATDFSDNKDITAQPVYTISGKVIDASTKKPVEGALVQLCTADTVASSEPTVISYSTTETNGTYTLSNVSANSNNSYAIKVTKEGYTVLKTESFSVSGNVTNKNLTLTPIAPSQYTVTINAESNMTPTGSISQTVEVGQEMTAVTYTAESDYYFPKSYNVAPVNGVRITRDSYTQITVSGTPTASATIELPSPSAKESQASLNYYNFSADNCTTSNNNDGKITIINARYDAKIEYKEKNDSSSDAWKDFTITGTSGTISGLTPGTYLVRYKGTDTIKASPASEITICEFAEYGLWVCGIPVTSRNQNNILGDSSTSTVTYNSETRTLTLNRATIDNTTYPTVALGGSPKSYAERAGIFTTGNLTINVTGNSSVKSTYGNAIRGDGDLTINSKSGKTLTFDSQASMRAITLDDQTSSLIITGNVEITATATQNDAIKGNNQSDAIVINAHDITIQDSAKLTAENKGENLAIYCPGTLAVNGSSTLIAKGRGNSSYQYAVGAGNFSYPGHSVKASENVDGTPLVENFDSAQLSPDAYKGGYKYVEVNPIRVLGVSLNESSLSVKTNQTATLTATLNPSDAAVRDVTWASSDTNVARVNAAGATCEVTAVGVGTATITVTTTDGSYTASCTVTVTRASSSGGSHTIYYPVNTPAKGEGGSVVVSPKSASKGSAVTVTVTPESGYQVSSVQAVDKDGKKLTLTDKGDGKYTFVMPGSKVEVSASFAQVQKPEEASPYRDVSKDSYYYDAVQWASNKGITNGVADGVFAPDWVCTRGQIVTFLWRSVGSPAPKTAEMTFADVAEDAYYAQAVLWAVENGITKGMSETTFSPDQTCTRAHAVAFLYRLAGSPAVTGSSFQDVAADAYYNAAVAWAVQQDITKGTSETTFSPNETCTRAQIVTFLYRMDQAK